MKQKDSLLKFDDHEVKGYFQYKLRIMSRIKKAFHFVNEKLGIQEKKKLSKLIWNEQKNYSWAAFKAHEDITMLVRRYQNHFTFYCYVKKHLPSKERLGEGELTPELEDLFYSEMVIFTFNTNRDMLKGEESDERVEDWFFDIDQHFDKLIEVMIEYGGHMLWNSSATKVPKFIEIKQVAIGNEIYSYDLLVFAAEELSSLEVCFFSENEMWERIKTVKPGDVIGRRTVEYVRTELPKEYSDPYYHGLGVKFKEGSYMEDVYCLTQFHFTDFFPEENLEDK